MPVQVSFPGVYVQELPSGVRSIAAVATSVGAFIGMSARGPLDEPTLVLGYPQFARIFGEEAVVGEMPLQVRQFFLNGGQTAWITRVARQAAQAQATLLSDNRDPVLRLVARDPGTPGNTIKAEISYDTPTPELSFNLRVYRETINGAGKVTITDTETIPDLSMDPNSPRFVDKIVKATSQLVTATSLAGAPAGGNAGSSFSGLVLPTDPTAAGGVVRNRWTNTANAFQISIGGQRFIDVTLPALPAVVPAPGDDLTPLLQAIQTAITNRLTSEGLQGPIAVTTQAIGTGQLIVFQSTTNGPVLIHPAAQNDLTAPLQLGTGQGGIETDKFGRVRPAPTGYFSRLHTTVPANTAEDLGRLRNLAATGQNSVTNWSLADANDAAPHTGSVAFFRPAAAPATSPMLVGTASVAADAALGSLQNVKQNLGALASAIAAGAPDWDVSLTGYRLVLRPKFGNANADTTATLTTSGGFDVGVSSELFGNAGAATTKPANVKAYSLGIAGAPGFQTVAAADAGTNGLLPRVGEYRTAFEQLERKADIFNLMVLPRTGPDMNGATQTDADRQVLWGEASAFCRNRRAFLIVDPPSDGQTWQTVQKIADATDPTNIVRRRIGVIIDHAAVYWPRLKVQDPATGVDIIIDPAGTIAGLYASMDARRGVWKAPAGLEAMLTGVRDVEHRISDRENGVINPMAVNAIRAMPTGVVVWGARTMAGFDNSGFDDYRYVPVRRLALLIEESLYRGLHFAVFEPNAEPLWGQIRLAAGAFMNTLFRQGAFKGEKTSDAYFVKCDEETTTQNDINLGIVNVVVGFAPLKPAEFVVITVTQIAGQVQT